MSVIVALVIQNAGRIWHMSCVAGFCCPGQPHYLSQTSYAPASCGALSDINLDVNLSNKLKEWLRTQTQRRISYDLRD